MDKVLESCFQLLSLFYLTIGRNNEAPATYALTSTIKRLLDHLTEVDLYSAKDLESIKSTLDKLSGSISQASDGNGPDSKHSPILLTLLSNRIGLCQASLYNLQVRLERIGEPLLPLHEKIISILRSISAANTKAKVGWDCQVFCLNSLLTRCSSQLQKSRSCAISSWRLAKNARMESSWQRMVRSHREAQKFANCITAA